jgi:hypothetical protein
MRRGPRGRIMRHMLSILIIAAAGTVIPAIGLWAADQRGRPAVLTP